MNRLLKSPRLGCSAAPAAADARYVMPAFSITASDGGSTENGQKATHEATLDFYTVHSRGTSPPSSYQANSE